MKNRTVGIRGIVLGVGHFVVISALAGVAALALASGSAVWAQSAAGDQNQASAHIASGNQSQGTAQIAAARQQAGMKYRTVSGTESALDQQVDSVFPQAQELYLDLHEHPELSGHETRTAQEMAAKLRALGYQVTEHVGGNGVVAIMKNGAGPVVMLRTELDALPVTEETGLPYASKVTTRDDNGREVGVMHACGHDVHMATLFGTAEIMAKDKQAWHGTLMLIGQPAEEIIRGAKAMVDDGLFKRFPRPDVAVALHDENGIAVGQVGVTPGYSKAAADSLRITVYGKGGHGARPESTIDPVVMAASIVVRLQSIVAREIHPGDAAVITVGYIQAGTKNNIIPDHAEMGLTVRSYKPEVRQHLLASIARIVKAEAMASGADKMPKIEEFESTGAVYNDPVLTQHMEGVLAGVVGKNNVVHEPPLMTSEDWAVYVEQGIPGFYYTLGVADPQKLAAAHASHTELPSNHSPLFAPVYQPAIKTGIATEVSVLRDLLKGSAADIRKITEQRSGE
ncbi:MAG TPA: amidohydrolase [Candidatus Angelobacter sp.]|nr:amidohydrolase [Candidatus Angelobacter sp.]